MRGGSLIIQVESHGVSNEVLSTWLQTELFVNGLHAVPIEIDTFCLDQ